MTTVLSWSGGKDAAYALYALHRRGEPVSELLTTITGEYDRSSMHGVRRSLYDRQARAIGCSIRYVDLPTTPADDEYAAIFERVVADYATQGVTSLAFGDLFLEDVRAYREDRLTDTPVAGTWPLWGMDTEALARAVVAAGFRATVVAVDGSKLDASAVGRPYDEAFLASLPSDVDPCGEHGSFHTFVWDGPVFDEPVAVEVGETVTRPVGETPYHFADLRAVGE